MAGAGGVVFYRVCAGSGQVKTDLFGPRVLSARALLSYRGNARSIRRSDLGDKTIHCMGSCVIPCCALFPESICCCKSLSCRWVLFLQ